MYSSRQNCSALFHLGKQNIDLTVFTFFLLFLSLGSLNGKDSGYSSMVPEFLLRDNAVRQVTYLEHPFVALPVPSLIFTEPGRPRVTDLLGGQLNPAPAMLLLSEENETTPFLFFTKPVVPLKVYLDKILDEGNAGFSPAALVSFAKPAGSSIAVAGEQVLIPRGLTAFNGGGGVAVRAVPLNRIVGFPELDELQLCSGSDTLAFLVYTTSEVPLTNVGIVARFGGGLEYGGFVASDVAGSVTLASAGNPLAPRLNIPSLTHDNPVIVYLGVSTNCTSLSGDYSLLTEFNYVYTDPSTSITNRCRDTYNFDSEIFAAAALAPILNINNTPAQINFTTLNQVRCHTLNISQDGINATMDSFRLTIDSLDLSILDIASISVNGMPLTVYDYDLATKRLQANIDNSFFLANGNGSPADEFFNEDETLTLSVCYSVPGCFEGALPNVIYGIDQVCQGVVCTGVGDRVDGAMEFNPNFGITPVATVNLLDGAEVCGADARLGVTFRSNSNNTALGLYENIVLTLNTCDSNFLVLQGVILNGVPLPASALRYTGGNQMVIDFTGLTSDPDGVGVGLDDVDGDSFYDDLPGDQTINMEILLAVQCPDVLQGCVASSCQISSIRINGERYCGRTFAQSANVPNSPVIGYESEANFTFYRNPAEGTLPNDRDGYNFGQIGYISGVDDTPSSVDMEFTYNFNPTNFVSCGGTHIFQFAVSSEPQIAFDMEFGNIEIGDTNTMIFTPIASGDIQVVDDVALSTRYLRVEVPNPAPGVDITMRWVSTLDTSYCRPPIYFGGAATIIEVCPTGCDCQLPKACGEVTMYVDPQDIGCVCDVQGEVSLSRTSLGYTDKTLANRVDPTTISANDLGRFLPGDTMRVTANFEILNADPFNLANAAIRFDVRHETTGGVNNMNRVRSIWNGQLARVQALVVNRPGTGETWDFSTLACTDEGDNDGRNRGLLVWSNDARDTAVVHPGLPDPPGSDPWYWINANHSDDRRDGNYLIIDVSDNNFAYRDNVFSNDDCLNPLRDMIGGFSVGDVITVIWDVPVIVNPGFDPAAGPELQPSVIPVATAFDRLNASTPTIRISESCQTNELYDFWEPRIEGNSEITYGPCGAVIEHVFKIPNPPIGWFANEFRPIIGLENLATTIPPPYIYSGGAVWEDVLGVIHPVEPDSSLNGMNTFTIGGATYYSPGQSNSQLYFSDAEERDGTAGGYREIDGSDPNLSVDQGDNDFTRVGGTFRPLSVGLDQVDSLVFRIPISQVCSEPVDDSGLEVVYYASYLTLPEYNNVSGPYLCNNSTSADAAYYWIGGVPCSGPYWDFGSRDTANTHRFPAQEGITYLSTGVIQNLPSLSSSISTLLLGDDPAGNEVNRLTLTAGGGAVPLPDVVVSVTVPSTVELIDVIDVNTGASLNPTAVAITADSIIYSVLVTNSMAPGTSIPIDVYTELLLCPSQLLDPLSVPVPKVCISATAGGCVSPEVAAILSGGAGACQGTGICYEYVGDASDIQIEMFVVPEMAGLCDEIIYYTRLKNVRGGVLFNLSLELLFPPGVTPVPGTWEYAYPGADDFGVLNWQTINTPPANPYGTYHRFDDVGDFVPEISASGFPGVSAPDDGNELAVRVIVVTNCEDFVSGRRAFSRTTAFDGCGQRVRATDFSEALIVPEANPVDFPRFLVVADPVDLNCGVTADTIAFTALALQGAGATENATMCITLPQELTYAGTLNFVAPASFVPANLTTVSQGTDTQVCFDLPDGIAVGQFLELYILVDVSSATSCGELQLNTDINSVVMNVPCSTGTACDINVNNSLNNELFINIVPPVETVELEASIACDSDPDNVTYDYNVSVSNFGAILNTTATISLYRDIDENGQLDDFDPLLDNETQSLSIATGQTVTLSGMLTAANAISCPVLLVVDYGSGCGCDREVLPVQNPEPTFIAEIDEPVYLCPGEDLVLEVCSDYTLSLSPAAGGTISTSGNMVTISINEGFGESEPVFLGVTGGVGNCPIAATRSIYQLPDLEIGPYAATAVCMDGVTQLDMMLPAEWVEGADISWSPTTYLSDPTSPTPEIENPTGPLTYTITASFNDGQCSTSADFPINVVDFRANIALMETTICKTASLALTSLNASISPAGLGGYWQTSGDGTFNDANTDADPSTGDFATATSYIPGPNDLENLSFVLTLRTDDPSLIVGPSACAIGVDELQITILLVDCGTFPWSGGN